MYQCPDCGRMRGQIERLEQKIERLEALLNLVTNGVEYAATFLDDQLANATMPHRNAVEQTHMRLSVLCQQLADARQQEGKRFV